MEQELELAYRTLNALCQSQPVSHEEMEFALGCIDSALHQARRLRRSWEDMGRHLQKADVVTVLAVPQQLPTSLFPIGVLPAKQQLLEL